MNYTKKRNRYKNITKNRARNIRTRYSKSEINYNIKLLISLIILLAVLLMKKYDISIGEISVDSIYDVVYYDEDISNIKDKINFINPSKINEVLQNTP